MNPRTSTAPAPVLPGGPGRRSRVTVLLVGLAVLIVAAGAVVAVNLTSDTNSVNTTAGQPQASAPAPTAPTTPADPQAATKAAILDAYRQSYDAFVGVGRDPNGSPDDPRLSQHKTGNALLASQISIQRFRNAGHVYVGCVQVHPTVVELTANTAVVADCAIGDLAVVEVATGRVVRPAGPPTGQAAIATYRLINGKWMQNTFTDEKRSCVPAPGS